MRLATCLLLALVVARPVAAQHPDSTERPAGRRVAVPKQLGPFTLARQQRYDDPAMGTMFRYLSPDTLAIDVFLYPGPGFDDKCSAECAATVLDSEVKGFRDSFGTMLERRYVDSIAVTADDTLHPGADAQWKIGRALRMRVVRRGEALRSDFVLWYAPTLRVKLRATYPDREPIRAYVRFFTDSLLGAIAHESRLADEGTRDP